jgi:DNA ligase D-like protein (predicted 3'-phosphoesterase)
MHVVGAQLRLYRSMDDCSAALESVHGFSKWQKSAEEIAIQNRAAEAQNLVVIKKHHATRLHYDFRLGWNGVLLSWVIPEGPSYCPEHKRKAIQVEDHAREYAGREGIIPEGSPGAGVVMLWDAGTWDLQPVCVDVEMGLRDGCLKFTMHGEKIKGNWTLIRETNGDDNGRRPIWWLIKDPDEFARASHEPSILEEAPNSVVTGRSLKEIAQDPGKSKSRNTFQLDMFQSNLDDGEWCEQAEISRRISPTRQTDEPEHTRNVQSILDRKMA